MARIAKFEVSDTRFPMDKGAGSDAIHTDPHYSFAVTRFKSSANITGTGLTFTLGDGNDLVCQGIKKIAGEFEGQDIEEIMVSYGERHKRIADHPQLRWLGPHKGVMHLALASVTNALFDLWAKSRGLPLWKLLLDLSSKELVQTLNLSYLEDVLTAEQAVGLLDEARSSRANREKVLKDGYPGYDTSVGWIDYSDEKIKENAKKAIDKGFTAIKLKVGSLKGGRDLRTAFLIREVLGDKIDIMLDANQQWHVPRALNICKELKAMNPFWIEEPTHPDDVLGHAKIAEAIAPTAVALGEHVPHRVLFKNYMQAKAVSIVQVDCTRVAGINEFIAVSLLAKKMGLRVVPHVGEVGQIHQHLVLFNHIGIGHERLFLEYIPHLAKYFRHPAVVENGVYVTPQEPGASTELL